jgi:hypothetical protein
LLLDIMLGTPLLRLSTIMHLLRLDLGLTIARQTRNGALNSSRNTASNAGCQIGELALCFLAFACGVLLLA